MKQQAEEWREKMFDKIVELDDDVLAAYFEVRYMARVMRATQKMFYLSLKI